MLLEDLRESILRIAREVAAEEGVGVWDVALRRGPRGWQVQVILDRAEGYVNVEECARANGRVRARLTVERTLEGDFDLEVSSPGLARPLRGETDFARFRGCLAKVKARGNAGSEVLVGRIVNVTATAVELDTEAGRRAFGWDEVAEARLEPELPGFSAAAPRPKKGRTPRRRRR